MTDDPRPVQGPPGAPPAPTEFTVLDEVQLHPKVVQALLGQLYAPVRPRGGLLLGTQAGGTLHVHLASTGGAGRSALRLDPGYLQGYSEAMAALTGGRWAGVGQWLMHADSQVRSRRRDRRWARRGVRRGLIDDRRVLLIVGWRQSVLTVRAYVQAPDGEVRAVPVQCPAPGRESER